jgi:hypothetical protein
MERRVGSRVAEVEGGRSSTEEEGKGERGEEVVVEADPYEAT